MTIDIKNSATYVRWASSSDIATLRTFDEWPSEQAWKNRIEENCVNILIDTNEIIGFSRWTYLWTTVPFLEMIKILPKFQGQNGSKKLLSHLCGHLKQNNHIALLSSSQTDEPKAQAWHIHQGFQSNGIIENISDEGIGEVVFRLKL